MDAAARVWAAFENRPASERTKDLWKEALREATAHGDGLPPPFDRIFREANLARARMNGAAFINPEATATGEGFAVLVPSKDHVKCILWGSQWSQAEGLRDLGFRKIHCDGTQYTSKLTGDVVHEAPREWILSE